MLITLSIVIAALVLMNISECYFAAKVGKNEKPMMLAVVMLCLVGVLFWQVWATGKSEPVNMNTSTYSWDVDRVNSSSEFKVNVTFVNGDWGNASVDASGGNKESMFVNEADLQKIRNGAASYMLVNKRTSTRLNRLFLIRDVETDSITHTLKAV